MIKSFENFSEDAFPEGKRIDDVKSLLKQNLSSVYKRADDAFLIQRVEQLVRMHKVWLDRVINTNTLESIVDSFIRYEKNLNNGLGPLSK